MVNVELKREVRDWWKELLGVVKEHLPEEYECYLRRASGLYYETIQSIHIIPKRKELKVLGVTFSLGMFTEPLCVITGSDISKKITVTVMDSDFEKHVESLKKELQNLKDWE